MIKMVLNSGGFFDGVENLATAGIDITVGSTIRITQRPCVIIDDDFLELNFSKRTELADLTKRNIITVWHNDRTLTPWEVQYSELITGYSGTQSLDWQESVLTFSLSDPPPGVLGARYVVGPGATGAWAGYEDNIATFNYGGWSFLPPGEGMTTYVEDINTPFSWHDGVWGPMINSTSHNHDSRYYTKTELDAGQLDNRYYTETESDSKFAPIVHNHDSNEVDLDTTNFDHILDVVDDDVQKAMDTIDDSVQQDLSLGLLIINTK